MPTLLPDEPFGVGLPPSLMFYKSIVVVSP
jgi:hypothetical protein